MNSKKKGNKNEREVAKLWESWTGYPFGRVPQSGGLRWQRTSDTAGDIICTHQKHHRRFQFSIECKSYSSINFEHIILPNTKVKVLEFWEQAKDDAARSGKIPILFMRYNLMPKNMHFVAMSTHYHKVIKHLIPNEYGTMTIHSKEGQFVIMNSADLISSNYDELFKTTRLWIREQRKSGV